MKRKAKLEDLGFDSEEAVATVEEFESVDEETFDKIVAVMKKKADKHGDKKKKKKSQLKLKKNRKQRMKKLIALRPAKKFWKKLKNQQMLLSQKLSVKTIQRNHTARQLANGLALFYSPFQMKTNNPILKKRRFIMVSNRQKYLSKPIFHSS